MNDEDLKKLKQELISVYENYLNDKSDNENKKFAQKLFFDNLYSNVEFDKDTLNAIHGLEHIGWDFSRGLQSFNEWKMGTEQAKDILNRLKGIKNEVL